MKYTFFYLRFVISSEDPRGRASVGVGENSQNYSDFGDVEGGCAKVKKLWKR